jgi:hypothetical protein
MSPDELIEEIILVDDGSTLEHLGDRLQKVAIFMFFSSRGLYLESLCNAKIFFLVSLFVFIFLLIEDKSSTLF